MATETFSRHLIRMARRKAGLTQAVLAERAGTSQAADTHTTAREIVERMLPPTRWPNSTRMSALDRHAPELDAGEMVRVLNQHGVRMDVTL